MRHGRTLLAALGMAALACSAAAAQPVVTGSSGWAWSDPRPQGEDLADVRFSGAVGFTAGAFGTVLRSDDAGTTWRAVPSGTTAGLTRIGDPVSGLPVVSGGCAVRVLREGAAALTRVALSATDDSCPSPVVATSFTDAANGVTVLQDGSVFVTADGGRTLSRMTGLPSTASTGGVDVPADIVAVGPTRAFAVVNTFVYRTVDGGRSWTRAAAAFRPLRDITFVSATVGFAVGDEGWVLRTGDGGETWARVPGNPPLIGLQRVACGSPEVCLVTVGSSQILRTTDGGANFTAITPAERAVRAVAFQSPSRAVAVGDGGLIAVSDDAGVTWRTLGSRALSPVTRLAAQPSGEFLAVGPRFLARSADAGGTWTPFAVSSAAAVISLSFPDPANGYALDTERTLFRTANGGGSWQILDPGAGGTPHTVLAPSPTRVVLVAGRQVRRSTDAGATFRTRSIPLARGARITDAALAGSHLVVWGRTALLVSPDAGATWRRVPLPVVARRRVALREVSCPGARTCWIVTTGGRVLVTTTQGRRWADVTAATGRARIGSLAAASGRRAYLALASSGWDNRGNGWVLATADGGASWNPQLVGRLPLVDVATSPRGDLALDQGSRVFVTTTGGAAATASVLTLRTTRAAFRRPTVVTLRGSLRPAGGGETVVVVGSDGSTRRTRVASSGSFTVAVRVRATTSFVAQWGGDGDRSGDGSPVVTIRRR